MQLCEYFEQTEAKWDDVGPAEPFCPSDLNTENRKTLRKVWAVQ